MRSLLCLCLLAGAAFAQGGNAVVSPDVHPDKTVTFRIYAPKASEVNFTADWLNAPEKMAKGEDGVWSLTVGPLAPTTYIYSYTVDGVAIPDPVNPRIKLRARGSASFVDVPADSPALWEARAVPHGAVEINWQKSQVLHGDMRSIWVYTPPGYEKDSARRYPVLYLMHGSNDTPAGWTTAGNINFILDNLLSGKKAVPMIVVMPFGHAVPYGGRGGGNNTELFEEYLLEDVMPAMEARYRVAPGRRNRALAGNSMGAEQALDLFFKRLDDFSSVGALSPSGFRNLETQFPGLLADAKGTNASIDVLWMACGRQDPSHFPGSQKTSEVLTAHHITHTFRPTDGVHNYALWRQYMVEFLPLLFQGRPAQQGP